MVAPGAAYTGTDAAAGRKPPRRVVVGAGLAGAALVVVAAVGLLVRATATPAPVLQPNSAVRIDPATNAVAAVVPAGDSPTGISADGDTVWVLSQSDRLLTGIPMAGGPPRTTGLPGPPTGIAGGNGAIWITFGFGVSGATGAPCSGSRPARSRSSRRSRSAVERTGSPSMTAGSGLSTASATT